MHYRGSASSSPSFAFSFSLSTSRIFPSSPSSLPAVSFFPRSISYRSLLPFGGKNAGTRRRITGRVVIIRHCRVMIRECARPLLYAFFLLFLPLPLKGSAEVVDGLNHHAEVPSSPRRVVAWKDRQFAINSSLRETKMRSPTMARSVAASNNRPNYIYTSSLSPSLSLSRGE